MAISWPISLPQTFSQSGFNQNQKPNTIRSTVNVGEDLVRPLSTSVITLVSGSMILNKTQYETINTFYNQILHFGVDKFNFSDPMVQTNVYEHRFLSSPVFTSVGPIHYRVDLQFERFSGVV